MHPKNPELNNMRRKSLFCRGLAGFFIVAMAAVLAGLVWFWGFLGRYERGTPEAAFSAFTQLVKSGSYEIIYEQSGFTETEYNSRADFIKALQKLFPQTAQEIKYQKKPSKDNKHLYSVLINGTESAIIELVPSENESGPLLMAKAILQAEHSIKIIAPEFITVSLDEKPLEKSEAKRSEASVSYYKSASPELAPYLLTYELSGLLLSPNVSAHKPNGEECAITEKNGVYNITALPDESAAQEYKRLIEKGAKTYAAFVSSDATFGEIDKLLWRDSPVAAAIRNFSNMWYIDHDSFSDENIVIKDITEHSENAFSGIISFDHVIVLGKKRNVYPSSYRMVFLQKDGIWKIHDLNVL